MVIQPDIDEVDRHRALLCEAHRQGRHITKTEAGKGRTGPWKWLRFAVVGAGALVALGACFDSSAKSPDQARTAPPMMKVVPLAPVRIAPGRGEVRLSVRFPEGYAPNAEAPSDVKVRSSGAVSLPGASTFHAADPHFPMSFPALFADGRGEVTVDLSLVYCQDQKASMCYIKQVRLVVPVTVGPSAPSGGGTPILSVDYRVQLPS